MISISDLSSLCSCSSDQGILFLLVVLNHGICGDKLLQENE